MTPLEIATINRQAFVDLGWTCGAITSDESGAWFCVSIPARPALGRRPAAPAVTQRRAFGPDGVLTVTNLQNQPSLTGESP